MATWLGSINALHSGNWEICKREGLFGSDRPAALNVRAADDILIWGAQRGWLGRVRATSNARPPRSLSEVPWPEPGRYAALIPIEVVDEPAEPLFMPGDEFEAAAGVRTVQIRNFERLRDDRAAYVTSLLHGRPVVSPPSTTAVSKTSLASGAEPAETGFGTHGTELLAALTELRVDHQLGRPAPYQQLVLLWAISRAVQGHERLQAFSTVHDELRDLLTPFAVGRSVPDPALAWYALRTSPWWRLIGVPEGPIERGRDVVRRLDPAGGLTREAHELVTSDPRFRQRAVGILQQALEDYDSAGPAMAALFPDAPPPASRFEEALRLLISLRGREITTTTGAVNRILTVQPPNVIVATNRSPQGQPVPIAEIQHALDLLQLHGAVTIDVDTLGHRSSFVGAVLKAREGVAVVDGPPPVASVSIPVTAEPWDPDPEFDGDTTAQRTVPTRREQGRLRATLFGTDTTRACALCGDEFPVAFLRAAHIKPRAACSEEERRQLRNVAMPACVFGCDALYEAGYITVDSAGRIVLSDDLRSDSTLFRHAAGLEGRRCTAHGPASLNFFQWHLVERFRGCRAAGRRVPEA